MDSENRKHRNLVIALIASLSVNLFIAGFIAARLFAPGPDIAGMGRHHPFSEGPRFDFRLSEAISPQGREIMHDVMSDNRSELRRMWRDLSEARQSVERAMTAEPFDAQSLGQALAEIRRIESASKKILHDGMVDVASQLPAEDRRALAERHAMRKRLRERIEDTMRGRP